MKHLRHFLILMMLSVSQFVSAQTGIDYLKKANEAFIKGNYSFAVTMYKMYYVETGKDIVELQRQAELCRDCLKMADDAAIEKDYPTAIKNYKIIIDLNPEDNAVRDKLKIAQDAYSVPSSFNVGDEYLGGVVAYLDKTGKHGFIIHSITKEPLFYNEAVQRCPPNCRIPSKAELFIMVKNESKISVLKQFYWCNTPSPYNSNEHEFYKFHSYYESRPGAGYSTHDSWVIKLGDNIYRNYCIYIKDF